MLIVDLPTEEVVRSSSESEIVRLQNLETPELMAVRNEITSSDIESRLEEIAKEDLKFIRHDSIKGAALRYGAQAGLLWRSKKIKQNLEAVSDNLDQVFNFQPLLLNSGRVYPPVIAASDSTSSIEGKQLLRTTIAKYSIISQAKIISVVPTWRDWLLVELHSPQLPEKAVMPLTEEEKAIWSKNVAIGWKSGVSQSDNIMLQKIFSLKREYVGLVRYHLMNKNKIISAPLVSTMNLGVISDGQKINVGEEIFEINVLPSFNQDSKGWEALPKFNNPLDF